ncbi:hypothetical protein FB451DRAFT_1174699 [Mycena latifolia]|nr:hypothetical protein FB451DRAFT_1174699 [Mycena latifolia]
MNGVPTSAPLGRGRTACRMCYCRRRSNDITKPAMRRLSRRGGVKRASRIIYADAHGAMRLYLEGIVRDAILYMEHGYRSTITSADVGHALRRNGPALHGID